MGFAIFARKRRAKIALPILQLQPICGALLFDLTLQQAVLRFFAMLAIISVHGLALAGAACALGDRGPRYDGRLRASPIAHLDLLGLAAGVFLSVGWIKPIAIDEKALRLARVILVILAPAIALIAVIAALRRLRPFILPLLSDSWSMWIFAWIDTLGQLGIGFALLNLLPIPPFTGSHLLATLLPSWAHTLRRSHIYAAIIVFAIAFSGILTRILGPLYDLIAGRMLGD